MVQGRRQLSDIEFQNIQNKYDNLVLRTAYIYLKDSYLAEDAYQETFIKIYKKIPYFDDVSAERMWIIKVTINICKDFYRKTWLRDVFRTKSYEEDDWSKNLLHIDRNLEPENICIISERKREILEKVIKLPSIYKDVIVLFYFHGYNTDEISKITGANADTVRKRLERARKALKTDMERSVN